MQSRRMVFLLLAVLSAVALFAGCGSSTKEKVLSEPGVVLSASTPTAGMKTCSGCHVPQTTAWLGSGHANMSMPGDLNNPGNPTVAQISGCTINCHDPNGDSTSLVAGFTGNVARPVVGCESCHGPGSLHVNAGGTGPISLLSNTYPGTWGSGTTQVSGQFLMCTSCHELLDSSGTATVNAAVATHLSPTGPAPTGTQYTITDTHFAVAKIERDHPGLCHGFFEPHGLHRLPRPPYNRYVHTTGMGNVEVCRQDRLDLEPELVDQSDLSALSYRQQASAHTPTHWRPAIRPSPSRSSTVRLVPFLLLQHGKPRCSYAAGVTPTTKARCGIPGHIRQTIAITRSSGIRRRCMPW